MIDHRAERLAFYDIPAWAIRKWWIGVVCIALGLIITGWVAFTSKPIYRAEAVLMLAQGGQSEPNASSQLGSLAAIAGLSLRGSDDRKAEALATLQSRVLTEAFVKDRNLLPVLFPSRWDSVGNNWRNDAKVPTLWDANKLFGRKIRKIEEDRKTGLITLAVEWTNPELAAEWTVDLIERTNKLLQEAAYQRATKNISYLKKQLEETNVIEVRQALYKLVESELKTSMLAQRSDEYVFRVVDPPVVPQEKVWPVRWLLLSVGLVAGIFVWVLGLAIFAAAASMFREYRAKPAIQCVKSE